jgi:hypothetical protein
MMLTGLTDVPTRDLERLLRAIHRGDLPCPFDVPSLTRNGLQHVSERLGHLRGLDARSTISVITAVIAERRAAEKVRRFQPREE